MAEAAKRIGPADLKAWMHDGGETAVLDAREENVFDARHLLFAACMPLGRIETLAADMVPRLSTRTVWVDDGEGLAERAAARMAALGYTAVHVLDGGVAAWETAGHPVYSGVHVPSKAFAEVVEHEAATPHVSAEELKALIDGGADIAIYDTRTYEEFHANSIPGAVSAPGAELVYRFKDLCPSPDTMVIVNCGGRTRSIIGAQALINAGVPNRVVSLKNGTQDWHLAGYEVVKGATNRAPDPTDEGKAAAKAYGARIERLAKVRRIDAPTLEAWQGETGARSLYLIDVRTAEEFEAGHAPGARNVAGGQLVQETDRHVATWGARIVLLDDDGVRATVTASWMAQMGWDVTTIRNADLGAPLEAGPRPPVVLGLDAANPQTVTAAALKGMLEEEDTAVVDLALSPNYRAGHIPEAWFALRSRLDEDLVQIGPAKRIVFTSEDGSLARLAAADHADAAAEVLALDGGTAAWKATDLPLETGDGQMASAPDDVRLKAREQKGGVEEAMRAYLAWEINLVNQMAEDDDHRFRVVVPA
ncbi:MAG: rhodanese-like domain-containing protein [Alphaproteobacteria bacterium]